MRGAASAWPAWVTSVITAIELTRAVGRDGMAIETAAAASEAVLRRAAIVGIVPGVISLACAARPVSLRSLDAIHLATALHLGDGIDAFCTYDRRLGAAAEAAGLTVLAPR